MGIQDGLNVIRNYRKSILHFTMLASIIAAAAATAAVEPALTNKLTSSTTSSLSSLKDEEVVSIVKPSPNLEYINNNDENRIVEKDRPAIPFCDETNDRTIGRRLLYVTTLDGRLTALDIAKGGKLRWSIPTGPGPLISSSIHRLELTNNGQFVRMIPSLSGGIYKFDGESIDPIPITTDNLLSSSAKFSDDLVISGGKETRTYGVSARTGQMLYECSMTGCVNSTDAEFNKNATKTVDQDDEMIIEEGDHEDDKINGNFYVREHDPLVDDVIVVRRQTQTVRAVETRTGLERWNFSVGQHELDLVRPAECYDSKFSNIEMAIADLEIKVVVPEGIICAYSKMQPTVMLWKYKFDHPIVSAWKISSADELEAIDMFGSAQWLWNSDENIFEMPLPTINPSIYVGMYDKQLYIQESVSLRKEILDQSNLYSHLTTESALPKIPWRPIAASSNSLIIYQQIDNERVGGGSFNPKEIPAGNELVPYDEDNFALTAQSVLNASEYVNGNGFYLYTSKELESVKQDDICGASNSQALPAIEDNKVDNASLRNHTLDEDFGFNIDDIDVPIKVVILSVWFWWKELAIVAFTSALLLNLLISQRNRGERQIVVIERHIPVPSGIEATESSTVAILGPVTSSVHTNTNSKSSGNNNNNRSSSESNSNSGDFISRFQSDFDLQRCLGRGGFGVVFEAKNKLDDCSYAIKRITLPNKEESRMRVMREVKTLANCEHQNIVRYFQSWVEKPPPGWQEIEDNKWLATEMSTSIQIDTPSGTQATFPTSQTSECDEIAKKKQLKSWIESMASTACSSDHKCNMNNGHYNHDDEDDDSCVIFRSESTSLAMRAEDEEEDDSDSCVVFRSDAQTRAWPQIQDEDTSTEDVCKTKYKSKSKYNKNRNRKKKVNGTVSIDIQSNSTQLNLHRNMGRRTIDYSQLSDSFQIEFVGSANGDDHITATKAIEDDTSSVTNRKRRPQDLALNISAADNSNNLRNVAAAKQNKVYLYIQMQLCRKESLRDWLRDNKREERSDFIASIFHQIVDAVDYVHFKGLIHRDLKPSNIFFSQDGQIKIGDFGLVTDMADIPNIVTKCGDNSGLPSCARHTQQVGTHLYMSPEQLHGLPYDYKVDIYSLGLIFFELLVYFGTEMERIMTLRALRDGKYPPDFPHQHPQEYVLLKKMLSPKPEERPTTTELKVQLSEILKIPCIVGDSEAAAVAAAARRLSRSRTFSSCE